MERRLLMKLLIKLIFGAFLMAPVTQAQDLEALANQVAETLGYPVNSLTVRDESVEYSKETNGQTLQVIVMESEDGTFARTSIAIAKRGFLLKPDFEARYNELITEGLLGIRRFDLKKGVYGYAGLGMGGPGGSETLLIATWPDRGIDLQIKMTVPREGLAQKEATTAYHALVTTDASELSDKLTAAMERIADYVSNTDIRYDESQGDEQKRKADTAAQSVTDRHSSSFAPEPTSTATRTNVALPTWWLVAALIVVVVISPLWLLPKKRK